MAPQSKVVGLKEAVATFVPDPCPSLAIGGMHMHNNPMALVRELARQGKRIDRLITSPSAGLNADFLIGAGLVREILTSYVGFEHLGFAPNFRRAVERGILKVVEADEAFLVLGLFAGAGALPFIPYPADTVASDITRVNGELRRTKDPYSSREVVVIPPIRPRVAFIHCQEADSFGNGVFLGSPFTDRQMALAAETTILQVERLVPTEKIAAYASEQVIPGFLVTAVVPVPYGCYPTASHGFYNYDEQHLLAYIKASQTEEGFHNYVGAVLSSEEEEYLDGVRLKETAKGGMDGGHA